MSPTNEQELLIILANHGVYDGKTSLYFQEDVDSFVSAIQTHINAEIAKVLDRLESYELKYMGEERSCIEEIRSERAKLKEVK